MEAPGRTITPEELRDQLAGPTPPVLLDIREPWEAELVEIPGSVFIPMNHIPERISELDSDAETIVYCHHGVRSARVLEYLEQNGFTQARHLTGGIDAYSAKVDPTLRRY